MSKLLGKSESRPLSLVPSWPSEVADDHTPVEFSLAVDNSGRRRIRMLGETPPDGESDLDPGAAITLLEELAETYALPLNKFNAIRDLFLPANPSGLFTLWFSFIFSPDGPPAIKVYLNPLVRGEGSAGELVAESLDRLGLTGAYDTIRENALLRGELDQFTFFALDISGSPQARVKVYLSHHEAAAETPARAAKAVPDVDPQQVIDFCWDTGGDTACFEGRPLISSYAFSGDDTAIPSNYSIYVPIRGYVPHDGVAQDRVWRALRRRGMDTGIFERALSAVAARPLSDGAGLLAHTSLRIGGSHSGVTQYLSAEAYQQPSYPPR
ncbi:tryptophan dimethylallyltransferase family protein [Saccharopolyspora gloriosae]|uniref:tryptophan dimethylallyltransferase family protein n=1 Tax=Saccharopolyspora gloriosae TaxID=455344 RepID=UPI001FB73147|nr:tryptophan dimethylallyltransferase family protein [Saccharopolyspora gloriosae]